MMDRKAIKILTKYFFPLAYGGKKEGDQNTPKEMAYLHAQGLHPETIIRITHATAVARLGKVVAATDRLAVANAFISGLNPDCCVHRAAFRAYAIGMNFPAHSFQAHSRTNPLPVCRICGMNETKEESLAYLELLRHRDGACGFNGEPFRAAYALEMFNGSKMPNLSGTDYDRLNELLRVIRSADQNTTANALANQIRPIVKGNKYTRRYVLETLGYCSILETTDHKGYFAKWTNWIENVRPPDQNNEMDLPAAWWRGRDGINVTALRHFFPHRQVKL